MKKILTLILVLFFIIIYVTNNDKITPQDDYLPNPRIIEFNKNLQSNIRNDLKIIDEYLENTKDLRVGDIKYAKFKWSLPLTELEKKNYKLPEEGKYINLLEQIL